MTNVKFRKPGLGKFLQITTAIVLLVVVSVVGFNTLTLMSVQVEVAPAPLSAVDKNAAAVRLSTALRFRTISEDGVAKTHDDAFIGMAEYIDRSYPRVAKALRLEQIGRHARLYTWVGSDPQAPALILMAHQDVVPVAPGTEQDWQVPPFSGEVRDGYIWGRGSWDDKGNLFAILEAVEQLLTEGFHPRQTVYLAFGDDEEIGGQRGGKLIAETLRQRGTRIEFILDEGLVVTQGILKGVERPVALVGVAEKGYATVHLTATGPAGHSSMPPKESAIGSLSEALVRLEKNPFPSQMHGVVGEMFDAIVPEMSGVSRVALSNLWLLSPVVKAQLEKKPSTDALLRTTTALTIVSAGNKENVVPGKAEATVNFRLLPGDTAASVVAHVKQVVGGEITVDMVAGNSDPSPVSPTGARGFKEISRALREVMPEAVVAPSLAIGGTDSRHFSALSQNAYRFSPVLAFPDDLARFHGTNERIAVDNYARMIAFYQRLLQNAAGPMRQ